MVKSYAELHQIFHRQGFDAFAAAPATALNKPLEYPKSCRWEFYRWRNFPLAITPFEFELGRVAVLRLDRVTVYLARKGHGSISIATFVDGLRRTSKLSLPLCDVIEIIFDTLTYAATPPTNTYGK